MDVDQISAVGTGEPVPQTHLFCGIGRVGHNAALKGAGKRVVHTFFPAPFKAEGFCLETIFFWISRIYFWNPFFVQNDNFLFPTDTVWKGCCPKSVVSEEDN